MTHVPHHDDAANRSITRQTEALHRIDAREDRETDRSLQGYAREIQGYIELAALLAPDAIRHLRNRAYSWERLAELTGRTAEELRAHESMPRPLYTPSDAS